MSKISMNFRKWVSLTLAAAFVMSSAVCVSGEPSDNAGDTAAAADTAVAAASGETMLENDGYTLSLDSETGYIFLSDKKTGHVWHSNPADLESDAIAGGQNKYNLRSQVILYYYDQSSEIIVDSFSQCVDLGNDLEYEVKDNTLYVSYYMGQQDAFSMNMTPKAISKERMEKEILPKLSEADQAKLTSRYLLYERDKLDKETLKGMEISFPVINKHDIYVRSTMPEYIAKSMYEILLKAGYTLDDLQRDCDENELENTYVAKPFFEITLEYSLNDDGMSVRVDPEKMNYSENYLPYRMELLPFFGAAGTADNGYMLVPDGSGAVIELNNGRTAAARYWKRMFNEDAALTLETIDGDSQESLLPVYALSSQKGSFIASIDEGYECAGICASIAGLENSYNYIYPFYDLFVNTDVSITSNQFDKFKFYSDKIFTSPISISYHMTEPNASYSKLAAIYREHLQENEVLGEEITSDKTLLNIDFVASAQVSKKFIGIAYTASEALTTFKQAQKILEELGVEDTQVYITNALKGSHKQQKADNLKTIGALGNKKTLSALSKLTDKLYISYYAAQALNVKKADRAIALNNNNARTYSYNIISRFFEKSNYMQTISPASFTKYAEKIAKSAKKTGVSAVNIRDLGYTLNSDFGDNYSDRHNTRVSAQKYMESLSKTADISVEKGSIFSLKYADKIRGIPITSSGYRIENYAVPFYQLVVNGIIPYSAEPVNLAASSKQRLLSAVALGAELEYSWIHNQVDNIIDGQEKYYNRDYKTTIEQAKEYSEIYKEYSDAVTGAYMTEHIMHSEYVTESVYSNGVSVLVNFSDKAQTVGETELAAESFSVVKKGAEQ